MNKLLKVLDFAALLIGMIGLCAIIGVAVPRLIMGIAREMDKMLVEDWSSRLALALFLGSIAWCALRWKKLNSGTRK